MPRYFQGPKRLKWNEVPIKTFDTQVPEDFQRIFARVLKDDDVRSYRRNHDIAFLLNQVPRRYLSNITSNIDDLKQGSKGKYQHLVDNQLNIIDETIDSYAAIHNDYSYNPGEKRPPMLCKYVKAEHIMKALPDLKVRYSTIEFYRLFNDSSEGLIPITEGMSEDELLDALMARTMQYMMEEKHFDFLSIYNDATEHMRNDCFAGCFSEDPISEEMW